MKINRKAILGALRVAKAVVTGREKIPALNCVLITAGGGALKIRGTDLSQEISMSIAGREDRAGESWVAVVRLDILLNAISGLGSEFADLHPDIIPARHGSDAPEGGVISGHCLPLIMPVDEFPRKMSLGAPWCEFEVGEKFFHAYRRAADVSSRDDSRGPMRGILVSGSHVVGTDGKRLYCCNSFKFPVEDTGVVFPKTKLLLSSSVEKISSRWQVRIGKTDGGGAVSMTASDGGVEYEYSAKLVEGAYPNYKQVMPESFKYEFKFSDSEMGRLVSAVKSCMKHVSDSNPFMRVDISPESVSLSASSDENGSICEVVSNRGVPEGGLHSSFNPRYILDAARVGNVLKWNDGDGRRDIVAFDGGAEQELVVSISRSIRR